MSECLKYFFTSMGVCVTIILIITCLMFISEFISDLIDDLKWEYKYKHRFDKPPVAKCYCKDCKYYNEITGNCASHVGWHMADSWFCWEATPMKRDPEKTKQI